MNKVKSRRRFLNRVSAQAAEKSGELPGDFWGARACRFPFWVWAGTRLVRPRPKRKGSFVLLKAEPINQVVSKCRANASPGAQRATPHEISGGLQRLQVGDGTISSRFPTFLMAHLMRN